MSLPTLYVGMANPVRDADIAQALTVETIGAVAAHFNVSRTAVRAAAARHAARRDFDLLLTGPDTPPVRVCHVVSCKPFTAVALAAFRTYAGTLKKLEIPGWKLTDGHASCTVADIQLALQSAAKAEKQSNEAPRARREARQRLGMEA